MNRDLDTVTVLSLNLQANPPTIMKTYEVQVGAEPWQVVIGPDNDTAYVVTRKDQKAVKIAKLHTSPAPAGSVAVGSEPTGLALTPTGAKLWVTNWVDGTLSRIDTASMTVDDNVDLNAPLVATGYLGQPKLQKLALAHPRSIAITNNGDASDTDEIAYVTEFFGQATQAEASNGSNSDTRKTGIVYRVKLSDKSVSAVTFGAISDMGFKDEKSQTVGCFPNQVQNIAINGHFAYVVSICESPAGPTGPKVTATVCPNGIGDCSGLNLVDGACVVPAAGQAAVCVDLASVKTTTAPLVSVIDIQPAQPTEVTASRVSLNAKFRDLFATNMVADNNARRYPLVANDIVFVPGGNVAYVSANGADAVFRVVYDASGILQSVGAGAGKEFINQNPAGITTAGLNPIGLVMANKAQMLITNNEATRNAAVIDLVAQGISGAPTMPVQASLSALPAANSDGEKILKGKRFFNTGTGRWSLRGQGWGACQSCHIDGLSDNVTWYFARGPRQSTSLDGTFASKDPTDQRALNWTAIFDEIADFEGNTRGTSGGVGGIVGAVSSPPATADRIDVLTACASPPCTSGVTNGQGNGGLNGSSAKAADPMNPLGLNPASQLTDQSFITRYIQTIRSPRGVTGLDMNKVTTGATLFATNGGCGGCHGGAKWTISKVFYDPTGANMTALKAKDWGVAATAAMFPNSLFPATTVSNRVMRFAPNAATDQLLCAIRPVGTFNVAEQGAGIAELRIDMSTVAQGGAVDSVGYNPPSLLGLSVGAPYFHGGNARTLEALFSDTFKAHHQSVAANFLTNMNNDADIEATIQYLLSIDEDKSLVTVPALGPKGGVLCTFP